MATVRFALVGVCYISEEHARWSGLVVCVEPVVAGTQSCQNHLAGPVKKMVCIFLLSWFQRCFHDGGLFLVMDAGWWLLFLLNYYTTISVLHTTRTHLQHSNTITQILFQDCKCFCLVKIIVLHVLMISSKKSKLDNNVRECKQLIRYVCAYILKQQKHWAKFRGPKCHTIKVKVAFEEHCACLMPPCVISRIP